MACGRLPDTGNDLCSQPSILSRRENAPPLSLIVAHNVAPKHIGINNYVVRRFMHLHLLSMLHTD
jgi:hypothetical protein